MTELRAITEDNFIDAFHLTLAPGQDTFVSHPNGSDDRVAGSCYGACCTEVLDKSGERAYNLFKPVTKNSRPGKF